MNRLLQMTETLSLVLLASTNRKVFSYFSSCWITELTVFIRQNTIVPFK